MIKNREIYGFHNSELMDDTDIVELTECYQQDEDGDESWLIIGSDYSGNSIGIDKDGEVVVYDSDLEEMCVLGTTFEDYILKSFEE